MEATLVVLLAIIATILFYRVVERRHKVLVGKIVAGVLALAILGAIGIGVFDRSQQQAYEARKKSVVVEFVERDTVDTAATNPFLEVLPRNDTVSSITFRICNSGKDTVSEVTFRPLTQERHRSTKYPLMVERRGDYSPSTLSSDYILAPNACIELTWSGSRRYHLRDSVFAQVDYVLTQ